MLSDMRACPVSCDVPVDVGGNSCGIRADQLELDFLEGWQEVPLYPRTALPPAGKHICKCLGTGGFLNPWENAEELGCLADPSWDSYVHFVANLWADAE